MTSTKWGRKFISRTYVLGLICHLLAVWFVLLPYTAADAVLCPEGHKETLCFSNISHLHYAHLCLEFLTDVRLLFETSSFFFPFPPPPCCKVSCRGQIFKVKRAGFWSGAQERCLHNSSRQMKRISQSAVLSIWQLWSVPASHEIPNKKEGGKEKKWYGDLG